MALWTALATATPAAATPEFLRSFGLQAPEGRVDAPDFSLPDLTGKTVRLAALRGKVVFLNFFATWCAPCRQEMPAMERLWRAHRDQGLVVLGVDLQEGRKTVAAFMRELRLSFPALLDADGATTAAYGIRGLPATFLIGRDGRILWRAYGAREWDSREVRRYFARLLAEGKP